MAAGCATILYSLYSKEIVTVQLQTFKRLLTENSI